ncbi:MAG: metallopeptidase [Cyanobacteriota bacterium]
MEKMKNLLFTILITFNLLLISTNSNANQDKPIDIKIKSKKSIINKIKSDSTIKTKNIKGFTIILNFDETKYSKETKYALAFLEQKLDKITKIVKTKQLKILKEVPIWVEWELLKDKAMCYHPSKEWLVSNGYPAEKEKSVEITNLRNFVTWQKLNQPYMVLHEFAHAYHDKTLGFNNLQVMNAYENAVSSKKYQNVEYNLGGKKSHYALTNEKEYFAELTESYLGENDFYPYNKAQLKDFDPIGYELMEDVWGK